MISEWRASRGKNVRRDELRMCHLLLLYILKKSIAGIILELAIKMWLGKTLIGGSRIP